MKSLLHLAVFMAFVVPIAAFIAFVIPAIAVRYEMSKSREPITNRSEITEDWERQVRTTIGGTNERVGYEVVGTNRIIIGFNAGKGCTNSNVVLIGREANTVRDHELVIRFSDVTELRQMLPTNRHVDMSGMWLEFRSWK